MPPYKDSNININNDNNNNNELIIERNEMIEEEINDKIINEEENSNNNNSLSYMIQCFTHSMIAGMGYRAIGRLFHYILLYSKKYQKYDNMRRFRITANLLSTINACSTSSLALYLISKNPNTYNKYTSLSRMLLVNLCGYLLNDTLHSELKFDELYHHLIGLFLAIAAMYVSYVAPALKVLCNYSATVEISTVFLNIKWILREMNTSGPKYNGYSMDSVASVGFLLSYVFTRLFLFPKLIITRMFDIFKKCQEKKQLSTMMVKIIKVALFGIAALQYFWFAKIIMKLKSEGF